LRDAAKAQAYHKKWRDKNIKRLREYQRQQRIDNRETFRATHRRWVEANKERNADHKKKWLEANRDTMTYKASKLRSSRKYYMNNPQKRVASTMKWQQQNPEKVKHYGVVSQLKRYGITIEKRDALFLKQDKKCAICKTAEPQGKGWHVDHCHSTGKVRGILCPHCNLMIGHARDSAKTLQAAIEYLNEEKKCA
jgi:hypothetical protein